MAAVFTRRIISSRFSPKLRLYLSGKELSCCTSYYFNFPVHTNFVHNRSNYVLKNVRLEPRYFAVRYFAENACKQQQPTIEDDDDDNKKKKMSLIQRFKEMYKKYWYVLVPVHLVTSAFWFGGFYYLAKRYVLYCDSLCNGKYLYLRLFIE